MTGDTSATAGVGVYGTAFQSSVVQDWTRQAQRWWTVPSLWQETQQIKKGATPSAIVYEEDRLKLFRYRRSTPVKHHTPLILVFALVNRPYILDLQPNKSVVSHFVHAGFDTYLVDWGIPTFADRHLTLDSYVNGYLLNVVEHVQKRCGVAQVSLLGYCMGGTMSAMFAALHPEKVRNLMLLAAGIDFATRDGLLNLWTDPEYFDVDAFVEAFGNCPPEFLQGSFLMLKPVANFVEKQFTLAENIHNEKFLREFFAMETWLNDNIPVPGEVFREFVKFLYQRNLLVKNQMPVGRHIVDLKKITCPVLNLMAERDDLVPCAQSEPFNDLISSADQQIIKTKAGHIGLAVGSRAQRELWPAATEWLAKRSAAP